MKIYHNPRCRKSREGLSILEESGQPFEIIKYLETPPSFEDLKEIITLLKIKPIDLIRKNETEWKENFKNKTLSDDDIINAMVEYPKLIERPIVIKNNQAIIGRPPTEIKKLL